MTDERAGKLRLELRRGILVLSVLASCKTPQYGYSLRKRLGETGLDIDEGTLYPLIRRLADQNLLDSEWQQTEGRERRYYRLSLSGQEVLSQLTTDWTQLNTSLSQILATSETP